MTEAEARAIMKAHGWTYRERIRHPSRTKYIYAVRKQGKKTVDCYICPLSKLGTLMEPELLTKLAPKSDQIM
jgi:hypothetical protein